MTKYIGAYEKNGKRSSGIYYGAAGIELFNIESFNCDNYTLIRLSVAGSSYQEKKEAARLLAIDVMDPNTFPDLSYGEYAKLSDIFTDFSTTAGLISDKYPDDDIDYYINGYDSHFYINNEEVY